MSIIMRPDLQPEKLPLLTLAAGTACAVAVEELTGVPVRLKWPNDLYINDFKIGGILTEAGPYSAADHKISFVVVGIGVNINTRPEDFPPELQNTVTSLYAVRQTKFDLDLMLAAIIRQLYDQVSVIRIDAAPLLSSWRKRDYLLGKRIAWRDLGGGILQGYGHGLRADGCYQLQTPDGTVHPILAGDLIVNPSAQNHG